MYLNLEIEKAPEYLKKSIEENRKAFADLMEQREKEQDKNKIIDISNQIRELINKDNKDHLSIQLNYINLFSSDPLEVLEDVKDILTAIEQQDFYKWLKDKCELFQEQQEAGGADLKEEERSDSFNYADLTEDYKSAVIFLQDILYLQVEALYKWNNGDLNPLQHLAEEKAAEWYNREQLPEEISKHNLSLIINKFAPVLSVDYPIDRPNNTIWKSLEAIETDGQLTIGRTILTGKGKKDKEVNVIISVSWNQPGAKLTTTLNEYDKRIYVACAALLKAGNEAFTTTEIYKLMTGKGSPSPTQTKRINESLTKLRNATLYYSNSAEIEKGYNYPLVEFDGSLLPFDRIKVTIKGKEATGIKLLREPPLISFARSRNNQITTYKKEVLQVPINDTEENLRIQDYLLTTISAMKNKNLSFFEVLFSTLKEACNISSKNFNRVPEKLKTCLKHYKDTGFINDYEVEKDRINITL